MDRRFFLRVGAGTPAALAIASPRVPDYQVVSNFKPAGTPMPGPYPGRVASVHCERSIDAESERVDKAAVTEMISGGMTALTGERDARAAWARFFTADDVVGIKINASGAPGICSAPEVVGEIAHNLVAVGVRPENIWVYERNKSQADTVPYEPTCRRVRMSSPPMYTSATTHSCMWRRPSSVKMTHVRTWCALSRTS